MQIRTKYDGSTVSVTHSSNRVIASAGADWSNLLSLVVYFGIDPEYLRTAPLYTSVVDIQKPAAASGPWTNSASGKWELFLAVPYAQATDPIAQYFIHWNFLLNGTPAWSPGDTQFVPIQNQVHAVVDDLVGRPQLRHFDSYAALEAQDASTITTGGIVFVTVGDATQIRMLQSGAPAGSDRAVSGDATRRWRQTGGG